MLEETPLSATENIYAMHDVNFYLKDSSNLLDYASIEDLSLWFRIKGTVKEC